MSRSPESNREALEEARREMRTARLAAYVQSIVDEAPPLTQEQRERIAAALHAPVGDRGGGPSA